MFYDNNSHFRRADTVRHARTIALLFILLSIGATKTQAQDPIASDKYFYSDINPYYKSDHVNNLTNYLVKQCTWYVWGRCAKAGWKPSDANGNIFAGYARDYFKNVKNGNGTGIKPRLGAIMCLPNLSKFGHIAYVTKVIDDDNWETDEYNSLDDSKYHHEKVHRNPNGTISDADINHSQDLDGFLYPPIDINKDIIQTVQKTPNVAAIITQGGVGAVWMVIGGVRNGKWTRTSQIQSLIKGGESYKLYTMTRELGTKVGGRPFHDDGLGDNFYIPLENDSERSKREIIGINAPWNPRPRRVTILKSSSKLYVNAVAAALKSKRLRRAMPRIKRIVSVDLDGSGSETILIEATTRRFDSVGESGKTPGKYSCILIGKMQSGTLKTSVLVGAFGGESIYELSNVLDLNGDGKMELIIGGQGYEGGGIDIFSFVNGKWKSVLSAGEGV